MNIKETLIGADVLYRWNDDDASKERAGYISFGEWDLDSEVDSFGMPDAEILLYVDGVEDMERLMKDNGNGEFVVLDYELRYKDIGDCP